MNAPATLQRLKRQVGIGGAVLLGLGSILGTGAFVSIGIGVGIAGPVVIAAIILAAMVALCNGLSSAQLAARYPVSGGTYEYGHELLHPALGFTAGWLFLCAKSASAASAALGIGIVLGWPTAWQLGGALGIVVIMTVCVLGGLRRSNTLNALLVAVAIGSLLTLVAAVGWRHGMPRPWPPLPDTDNWRAMLQAAALMFVAYTGYGRVATLGEEVRDPRRSIPRAVIAVLLISMLLYGLIAAALVIHVNASTTGEADRSEAASLLANVAMEIDIVALSPWVTVGAVAAMLGVLLNLILGLSRVMLAMGRRGDMPGATATLNAARTTPTVAVIAVGVIIAALVCVGDIKATWSFSAFTVLIYYALTNLCALRLPRDQRLFPRWIAACGLVACGGLAFWVEMRYWLIGLGLIGLGLIWHLIARRMSRQAGVR